MPIDIIEILSVILFFIGIYHYLTQNDEFVLLLMAFYYATGLFRYLAVLRGDSQWAIVAYAYDIFDLNDELALEALNYFLLGTAIFSISYVALFSASKVVQTKDNQQLFKKFILKNQRLIIVLFVFFLLVNAAVKSVMSGYTSFAYGMSYFFLFKLALGGLILLFFLLYKNMPLSGSFQKIVYLIVIVFAAYSSYDPNTRFQFLSWMIALNFVIIGNRLPLQKAVFYLVGGTIVIFTFAMAGNKRHAAIARADFSAQVDYAIERLTKAEDQNMLDGFMMVLQVYPKHLEYHLGMEHLEILMRPIPRKLWPGKPVGGYANKLGLNEGMPQGATVGISQSIYGSFYGEGGIIGIILFSILYGYAFVMLFRQANKYNSDMRYLIKGVVFASAVPLLRGGDLPGIFAFIGMSYWPIFIFIFLYNRFLNQQKQIALNEQNEA